MKQIVKDAILAIIVCLVIAWFMAAVYVGMNNI